MSKAAKWVISIITIIVIVAVGWYWSATKNSTGGSEGNKMTITIGATLPLTGNLAFLGTKYQDAINLAMSEAGSSRSKYNYRVVFEDDQFDPAKGATAVNKLIGMDKADALLSFGSPVGNVVSPIAEKNKVTHINGIASDPNVARGNYNFVHWTPPYEETKLMVKEMQKRGIKKVALFELQSNPGSTAIAAPFKKDIEGTDIKLVDEEKFDAGDRDFRSLILKAKSSGAEIFVLEVNSPELEILVKQIREMGIKTPLTSIECFEFADQSKLFEGLWYVSASDQTQAFIDKFTRAFGSSPKLGSGNGYDSAQMLISAFEHAGDGKTKPTSDQVVAELLKIKDFDGAMGNLSMGQDHIVDTKAVVRMIKNGTPVTIPE